MQLTRMRIFDPRLPFNAPNIYHYGPYATSGNAFDHTLATVRPIFLSHKNEDTNAVEHLAAKMHHAGIPTYMDTKDPTVQGDNVDLVHHIRRVIKHCPGLLAYVTEIAQQSWWIPLEIAFAMESTATKHIATYKTARAGDLPSYLWEWPIVKNDDEVIYWSRLCKEVAPQSLLQGWKGSLRYMTKSLDHTLDLR